MPRQKFMTKKQAMNLFETEVYPNWKEDIKRDNTKVRCAWLDFTDGLEKDGQIPERHRMQWTNPYAR